MGERLAAEHERLRGGGRRLPVGPARALQLRHRRGGPLGQRAAGRPGDAPLRRPGQPEGLQLARAGRALGARRALPPRPRAAAGRRRLHHAAPAGRVVDPGPRLHAGESGAHARHHHAHREGREVPAGAGAGPRRGHHRRAPAQVRGRRALRRHRLGLHRRGARCPGSASAPRRWTGRAPPSSPTPPPTTGCWCTSPAAPPGCPRWCPRPTPATASGTPSPASTGWTSGRTTSTSPSPTPAGPSAPGARCSARGARARAPWSTTSAAASSAAPSWTSWPGRR